MPAVPVPPGYTEESFACDTSIGNLRRRLLRAGTAPPVVILMHESPGISDSTLEIARHLREAGYSTLLPELLPLPRTRVGMLRDIEGIVRICLAREMEALHTGRTGAIVEWLRALAAQEARVSGSQVAIVGMCFSGGFALAAMTEPLVAAGVLSQPSLPLPMTAAHRLDLGASGEDMAKVARLRGDGRALRVMRYEGDWKAPRARFERLVAVFPGCSRREIPTDDRRRHSVIKEGIVSPRHIGAEAAVAETLSFLKEHLPPEGARDHG